MKCHKIQWLIGVGGVKCATTWLYHRLNEHPAICMTQHKETHYFSSNYSTNGKLYFDFFEHCKGTAKYRGEISTSYLYSEDAPNRINNFTSNIILLVSLRNPFDRLLSHYEHLRRSDQIPAQMPLDKAIQMRPEIVEYGRFGHYLKVFYELFGRDRIIVFRVDDLEQRPYEALRDLFQKLGLDHTQVSKDARRRIGQGYMPRWMWLDMIRRKTFYALRDHGFSNVINLTRESGLSNLYRRINGRKSERPRFPMDAKFNWVRDTYAQDIELLEQQTGICFENWKQDLAK